MRTKYKSWSKPFLDEHSEVSLSLEELAIKKNYYLEIGSGKGMFLLNMAKNNPENFYVGIEKNVTCAGFVAKKLVENEINNAKILFKDASEVLDIIPSGSINTIYLNFSDPWPKKRHAKRRLTCDAFFDKYYASLVSKGEIVFKTDNLELFDFTKEIVENSNKFIIKSITYDYDGNASNDFITEYEKNFREKGISIKRMVLVKND